MNNIPLINDTLFSKILIHIGILTSTKQINYLIKSNKSIIAPSIIERFVPVTTRKVVQTYSMMIRLENLYGSILEKKLNLVLFCAEDPIELVEII